MADVLPSVDEVVGLLERYDLQELGRLRNRYPGHAKLFEPGLIMGRADTSPVSEQQQIEIAIRAETSLIGVAEAERVCASLIIELQHLINRVSKLQLAMQVLTLVSGASIVVVLKSTYGMVITYVLAVINLVASAMGLFAKHLGNRENRKPGEDCRQLIECRLRAEQIRRELKLWQDRGFVGVPIQLIQQANEISFKINEIESHSYWVDLPRPKAPSLVVPAGPSAPAV